MENNLDVGIVDGEEFENEESAESSEKWTIEDDQAAEWAVKKIKEARAEAVRWRQYYSEMILKAEESAKRTEDFLTEKLRKYFNKVPHKETKTTEKYPLPSGDLILRKPKTVWNHDDDTLLEWLKENGFSEFVKVTEKPDWAGFKKRLVEGSDGILCDSETGLVCDAVTSEMSDSDFKVM